MVSTSLSGCWGKETPQPTPVTKAPETFPLPDSIPDRVVEPEDTPTPEETVVESAVVATPTPTEPAPYIAETPVPPPVQTPVSQPDQASPPPPVQVAPPRAPLTTQERQARREKRAADKKRRKEERAKRKGRKSDEEG
ncbi:MAG: hypothetical protein KC800_31205 [Candidatus Eremiobacteraeota bacterium]|nr:hypothetical protein [Candidatus Eremiobacteraeota bacterium]